MKCPKCGFEQILEGVECQNCGIIFSKYRQLTANIPQKMARQIPATRITHDRREVINDLLFHIKPETNSLILAGRSLFFVIILMWSCKFILKEMGWIKYDHNLAHFAHILGCVLMIFALVWGGYILYKQYRNRNTTV
jgi:hypothetical protein